MIIYTANIANYDTYTASPYSVSVIREKPSQCPSDDPTRIARWCKTHPHILFPDAVATIWVDSNLKIHDIAEYVKLFSFCDLFTFSHLVRTSMYDEARECIYRKKDDALIIAAQIDRYKRNKFESLKLPATRMVGRRHVQEINNFNERWWFEIERGSRRDQLSFEIADEKKMAKLITNYQHNISVSTHAVNK